MKPYVKLGRTSFMKSLCLTLAALLGFLAVDASGKSAFLRVGNKFGDYWIFRFSGQTINLRFDVDHRMQKDSDREVNLADVDLTFGGLPLSQVVFRPDGANLAKIRLLCKQAGCVYSHFDSKRYDELDILCENEQDCVTFVSALL